MQLRIDQPEAVDRLLEPLGDREIPGLDHVATVGLGVCLAANNKVRDFPTNESLKLLEVALVEIEIARPGKHLLCL
ncbi:hypothetical protein FHT77_005877 [Rhizobium sp. BK181]|nr:hypothetical protein [Rhizobium sp. BK181]